MATSQTDPKRRYAEGSEWEEFAGYSRASRIGQHVAVSGTTSTGSNGEVLHPGDTFAQTITALESGLSALAALGGDLNCVIRTRILLAPGADWKDASRAHASLLSEVAPANSMYFVHGLIGDGYLVEVEIDAIVGADD